MSGHSPLLAMSLIINELADGPPIARRQGMEIIELVVRFLASAFTHLYLVIAFLIAGPVSPELKDATGSAHEDAVGPLAAFEYCGGQIAGRVGPVDEIRLQPLREWRPEIGPQVANRRVESVDNLQLGQRVHLVTTRQIQTHAVILDHGARRLRKHRTSALPW